MSLYWFLWSHPLLYTLHCPDAKMSPSQSIPYFPNHFAGLVSLFPPFPFSALPCSHFSCLSSFLSFFQVSYQCPIFWLYFLLLATNKQTNMSHETNRLICPIFFKLRIVWKKNYLKLLSTKRHFQNGKWNHHKKPCFPIFRSKVFWHVFSKNAKRNWQIEKLSAKGQGGIPQRKD